MPNFLKDKMESFKQFQKSIKERKYTKKDAAIGLSVALILTTISGISGFNPGELNQMHVQNNEKKVSIAEFSKLAGPQQDIMMRDKNAMKRKIQKKTTAPLATETQPVSSPFSDLSSLGSGLNPSFSAGGMGRADKVSEIAQATFNKHKELNGKLQSLLSSSFQLKKSVVAPTSRDAKFSSSYEMTNDESGVLERFELMSIIKTPRLKDITTAQQALDSLVEESQSMNVIESTDEYLIYEFAGSGGYQIGKIAVDDNGIHIFGYVNLTTSEMPDVLRTEWINHYRSDL